MQTLFDWLVAATFGIALGCVLFFFLWGADVKTYARYEHLPKNCHYLGSELGDGTMYESLADAIERAVYVVRLRDEDGTYSYFEVCND